MDSLNNISISQIFIGYEERERKAYEILEFFIGRDVSQGFTPTTHCLKSKDIKEYNRNWGEPQSTDFTFTRFWVPYLSNFTGYSLFMDCDFLWMSDAKLSELASWVDRDKAVSVCQHPSYNPNSQIKMDGVSQHRSFRKNWASFIVFNNEHPSNKCLTPDYLNNHRPGLDFHHFNWLTEDEIGSLPLDYNCLDGYYHLENPKAIHYTDGGPWFENYTKTQYSQYWLNQEEVYDNNIKKPQDAKD